MFKRFPQLQSGFLAPSEQIIEKPVTPPSTPMTSLMTQQPVRSNQDLFYVPAIDAIVDSILRDPFVLRDFSFQAKVFNTIGKAFGGGSFASFIRIQGENPSLSSSHIEFMKETVLLVDGAISQRTVGVDTWATVLSASNPSNGGFKPTAFFSSMAGSRTLEMKLSEFLTEWVRVVGYTDMLLSMRVIFGRRGLHAIQGGVA